MLKIIKKLRNKKTSQEVLNFIGDIQNIRKIESYKAFLGLKNDYGSFLKLETIAYKIAVHKANTVEELEECAVSVEEHYCGKYDPNQWAEEIRIKAYGIVWHLKRHFNSPAYEEFVNFSKEINITNPFEYIEQLLVGCDYEY